MLQLSSTYQEQPVLSLRTGGVIATAVQPIMNPNNLKIEGFYCDDLFEKKELILLSQDIREHAPQGFIVNDHEVLVEPEELVRLEKILALKFELHGKTVVTVDKKRLGKVTDYAVDDQSLYVQKLYIGQSVIKNFTGTGLSVDRSQIFEVTDKKIIVQNPLQGVTAAAPVAA